MKIQKISLPENYQKKLTKKKWHLWRGGVEHTKTRPSKLISLVPEKYQDRLKKLLNYISNNKDRIVDYRARKNKGLVFTSNLAEYTVESLINKRCKKQEHMRWSREGVNPLLQLRAAITSNDWNSKWQTAVLNAVSAQPPLHYTLTTSRQRGA